MSEKNIVLFVNQEEYKIIKKALRVLNKHYPSGEILKILSEITKIKKVGGEVTQSSSS